MKDEKLLSFCCSIELFLGLTTNQVWYS